MFLIWEMFADKSNSVAVTHPGDNDDNYFQDAHLEFKRVPNALGIEIGVYIIFFININ